MTNPSTEFVTIDAAGKVFGRLATLVATTLQGKDVPTFSPHTAPTRHVIVVNCDQLVISTRRSTAPYYHHTGYIGNLTEHPFTDKPLAHRFSEAVRRMLPKNKRQNTLLTHLHCYAGTDQPHTTT